MSTLVQRLRLTLACMIAVAAPGAVALLFASPAKAQTPAPCSAPECNKPTGTAPVGQRSGAFADPTFLCVPRTLRITVGIGRETPNPNGYIVMAAGPTDVITGPVGTIPKGTQGPIVHDYPAPDLTGTINVAIQVVDVKTGTPLRFLSGETLKVFAVPCTCPGDTTTTTTTAATVPPPSSSVPGTPTTSPGRSVPGTPPVTLPATGTDPRPFAWAALVVLAAGGLALFVGRRRSA